MTPGGATFAPARVYSGQLSWLYIFLHDTITKCHAGASHPDVSSPQLYRGKNFTSVRNLATVTYKRETTTRYEIGLPVDWNGQHMRNVCDFEPLVIYHSMFVIYLNYSQTVFKPLLGMFFCTCCSVCLRRFNFQVIKKTIHRLQL